MVLYGKLYGRVGRCRQYFESPRGASRAGFSLFSGIGRPVNADLVRAIASKRLIEIIYKAGRPRTVEPHDYGIQKGVERLLGYQLSGESASGTPHGWKCFVIEEVRDLRVLARTFPGPRADASQQHRSWEVLFARVAP